MTPHQIRAAKNDPAQRERRIARRERGRIRSATNAAAKGLKLGKSMAIYQGMKHVQKKVEEEWQNLMDSTGTDGTTPAAGAAPKSAGRPDLPDCRRHERPPGFPKFMPPPPPGSAEAKAPKTGRRSAGRKSGESSTGEKDQLQRSNENNSDPISAQRPVSADFMTRVSSTLDEILESEYSDLSEPGDDDE